MSVTSNFLLLENTALNLKLNLCLFVIVLSSKEKKNKPTGDTQFLCVYTPLDNISYCFPKHHCLVFWDSLLLALYLPSRLGWLSDEPQRSPSPLFFRAGITSEPRHTQIVFSEASHLHSLFGSVEILSTVVCSASATLRKMKLFDHFDWRAPLLLSCQSHCQ